MPDAILYVPEQVAGPSWRTESARAAERLRWVDVLAEYCAGRGYTVIAVCSDSATATAMQAERPGRKLIVGRLDWFRDIEIVTIPSTHPVVSSGQRRAQRRPRLLEMPRE